MMLVLARCHNAAILTVGYVYVQLCYHLYLSLASFGIDIDMKSYECIVVQIWMNLFSLQQVLEILVQMGRSTTWFVLMRQPNMITLLFQTPESKVSTNLVWTSYIPSYVTFMWRLVYLTLLFSVQNNSCSLPNISTLV